MELAKIISIATAPFYFIRDFYYKQKHSAWMNARRKEVLSSLLSESGMLNEQAFIENGTYHWKYTDGPIDIDFFFPNIPLAVKVTSKCRTTYNSIEGIAPSRKFWQAQNESDSLVCEVCTRAGVPILAIGPYDPVDAYTIAAGVREAIGSR